MPDDGDVITGFTRGTDKLLISGYSFGMADRKLNLVVTADPQADRDKPTFLFESDTGRLWFDEDGNGAGANPVLIATLQNVNTLSPTDFAFL